MYIFAYGDVSTRKMVKMEETEETTQCSRNRSPLEKCLITFMIAQICCICVLGIYGLTLTIKGECDTPECIRQAAWLRQIVSEEISPCDDFYQFVCPSAEDDHQTLNAKRLKAHVERQVRNLMHEGLTLSEPVLTRTLKKMFRACLNVNNKKKDLDDTLRKVTEWGLLRQYANNFDWLEFLNVTREHGLAYDLFFDLSVVDNLADNGEPILRIGPPNVEIETISTSSEEMKTFSKQLSKITRKGLNDYTVDYISLKEFDEMYSFTPLFVLDTTLDISENDTILLASPNYFKKLMDLLYMTDNSILADYMQRHVLKTIMNEYFRWTRYENQESFCANKTRELLPHLTEVAYVRKYHTDDIHKEVKTIAAGVKDELLIILRNAEWLNNNTKTYISRKVEDVNFLVGAPESFLDPNFQFARATSITDEDNFLLMTLNANRYIHYHQYSTLKNEKFVLSDTILSVSPFYSFADNLIVLPAAALQNPIFQLERPKYLNYGLLGAIIGRELTRAFIRFAKDSHEECLDVDWSLTLKQIQCLKEQYASYNYSDGERIIKGEDTMANIAGTKSAYLAYRRRIELYELDRPLLSLNFTAEQMFWVAKAIHGCYFLQTFSSNRPALWYEVMSPLMNLESFTHDFKCYQDRFDNFTKCDVL